jgi:hypothetical protein
MTPKQRQRLISMVREHIKSAGDDDERFELEQLINALNRVNVTPEPLGLVENVGSCLPGPIVRWDKTGSVWHTDVDKVGRYSVRRQAAREPYAAYLNGVQLMMVMPDKDPSVIKRSVERRIRVAKQISQIEE